MCSFAPGRTSSSTTARSAKSRRSALAAAQPIQREERAPLQPGNGYSPTQKVGAARFASSLPKKRLRIDAMLASLCK